VNRRPPPDRLNLNHRNRKRAIRRASAPPWPCLRLVPLTKPPRDADDSFTVLRKFAIVGAFLGIVALAAGPIWVSREQWHFGQSYDDQIYWILAKAIASGKGYRFLSLPGAPYAVKYPPLYPLYLSIAWRLNRSFPGNLATAAILHALLLPVFVALLFILLRQLGLSWRRTVLISALAIGTHAMILLNITLFSEMLFGCFLLGTFITVERSAALNVRRPHWWAMAGGLLAGLAYLTRSAALPVFAAVPLFYFLRKRFRLTGWFFAIAAPPAGAWLVWGALHPGASLDPVNTGYLDEYLRILRAGGFTAMFTRQLATLSLSVAETLVSGSQRVLGPFPVIHLAAAAALMGSIRLGRKRHWPVALVFSGMYLLLITCWWSQSTGRFLMPVWPVLLAGVAEEASHFASLCEKSAVSARIRAALLHRLPRWGLMAAGALLVFHNGAGAFRRVQEMAGRERQVRFREEQTFAWIAQHRAPGAVLLTWKDGMSYLYTGVPASHSLFVGLLPDNPEYKALSRPLSTLPPEYKTAVVLVMKSDLQDAAGMDAIRGRMQSFEGGRLAYSTSDAFVYTFPVPRAEKPVTGYLRPNSPVIGQHLTRTPGVF
jgi:hypothetical protein